LRYEPLFGYAFLHPTYNMMIPRFVRLFKQNPACQHEKILARRWPRTCMQAVPKTKDRRPIRTETGHFRLMRAEMHLSHGQTAFRDHAQSPGNSPVTLNSLQIHHLNVVLPRYRVFSAYPLPLRRVCAAVGLQVRQIRAACSYGTPVT